MLVCFCLAGWVWGFCFVLWLEFLCIFVRFRIGSYCVDLAGFELERSTCLCLPTAGINGVRHHTSPQKTFQLNFCGGLFSCLGEGCVDVRVSLGCVTQ